MGSALALLNELNQRLAAGQKPEEALACLGKPGNNPPPELLNRAEAMVQRIKQGPGMSRCHCPDDGV